MNIKYFMLTTDSGNNEDYNIFYCPIFRVTGDGDFSEPVFASTSDIGSDQWVDDVETLGYNVEAVELNYTIPNDDDDEEDEAAYPDPDVGADLSGFSGKPIETFNLEETMKRIFGGAEE